MMHSLAANSARKRRYLPQFPLRLLIVVMLAVCCFLGGRASRQAEVQEYQKQQTHLLDVRLLMAARTNDMEDIPDCRVFVAEESLPADAPSIPYICTDFDSIDIEHPSAIALP
jgi:hypothetical protein